MRIYWKLVTIILDVGHILEPVYIVPKRTTLLFAYLKIRIKASLNRFFHFHEEHFLGFTVSVLDYDIFLAIFRQVFVRNVYYVNTKNKAPTIIDCGGNMGMTVLYWKYLFPESKVTVFEPSREVVGVLRNNIAQNKLQNIRVVEAAVSNREGRASMYMRGAAACGNTLSSSINDATINKESGSYEVETVKLSRFIETEIDILKMDIEGAEGMVCDEIMKAGKFACIKELVMEYHYYPQEPTNSLSSLLDTLKKSYFESQIYFEEYDPTQQISLSRNGSYAAMLRAVR